MSGVSHVVCTTNKIVNDYDRLIAGPEPFEKHEYIPLSQVFHGMDADRVSYLLEHLQPYVEKYREDRKKVGVAEYPRIEWEYLDDIKDALVGELEVEKIEPARNMKKAALIAGIGYGISIPVMLLFPVLEPFLLPELLMGVVTEESVRNLYYGIRDKRRIQRDLKLIAAMPTRKFAWALEDLCYYPAKTEHEKNQLKLKESRDKGLYSGSRNAFDAWRKLYERLYSKPLLPQKMRTAGKHVYDKVSYYLAKP